MFAGKTQSTGEEKSVREIVLDFNEVTGLFIYLKRKYVTHMII